MAFNKNDVLIIRAKQKDDYVFDGIKNTGYNIMIPYRDKNLLLRCAREAWFRLNLPCREIWFNSKIKKVKAKVIIIKDPLIVPSFLKWVKDNHVNSRVIIDYDNRVSRSVNPESIDSRIERWTYDEDDAAKYGMHMKHGAYFDIYQIKDIEQYEKSIDVLYLGRDKGRLENLLNFQKIFENLGLSTMFHICADRSFLTYKNPIYKPLMPYKEYLDLLKKSRTILNVVPVGQKSITQREYEAVFDNVKCITNNTGILDSELYDQSRFFVVGIDSYSELKTFLDIPFKKVDKDVLNQYKFDSLIEQIFES